MSVCLTKSNACQKARPGPNNLSLHSRCPTGALALVDVQALDNFVVSFEDTVSFAEREWL